MGLTIYVVEGSTGEYSDRNDWPVRAFRTEEAAKAEVTRLSELARVYEQKKDETPDFWDIQYDTAKHAAFKAAIGIDDPHFSMDYTGTRYAFYAVELEDQ
jgi:hypothetical protein